MFSRFAAFYGHTWRSQFKNEGFLEFAKKEWEEALTEFSDAVLDRAILECRGFYEFPPSLAQIIQCCRQIKKRNEFHVVSQIQAPTRKELAIAHLKQCKDILTKK